MDKREKAVSHFNISKEFMKRNRSLFCILISTCIFVTRVVFADTLVLQNGGNISGTILKTNDDEILLLTSDAAFNFKRSALKEIKVEPVQASQYIKTGRFLDFKNTVLLLSKQSWATNLTPIPATVIDKGVLRNIPYSSFRCGEDYELNIYGDLEHPAGIEIGIYRKLIDNPAAKQNCLDLIRDLLCQESDKAMVQKLNLKSDYQLLDDLSFEITPPTDSDSYNGWWVSIYSEEMLNKARATDDEIKRISLTKAEAPDLASDTNSAAGWSVEDLKLARSPAPTKISFIKSSGEVVTNAEVVRVIDGVSLIYWSGPFKGGMVKLADLPEKLRNEFGYDAAKTEAADVLAREQKARWQQQLLAAQAVQGSQDNLSAQYLSPYPQYYSAGDYSGAYSSGGGRVYVHGYTKKDGTYISPHTRSSPHRR